MCATGSAGIAKQSGFEPKALAGFMQDHAMLTKIPDACEFGSRALAEPVPHIRPLFDRRRIALDSIGDLF
jgi:hypothetical protein